MLIKNCTLTALIILSIYFGAKAIYCLIKKRTVDALTYVPVLYGLSMAIPAVITIFEIIGI